MSDTGHTRPSLPVLVDTLSYPREFSFSLVCSLMLHLAVAAVLLQSARLPSVETVRDVFLTPDWTVAPTVRDPRPPGAGALEVSPGSSPAPRVVSRPASPPRAAPRPAAGEDRIAKAVEPAPAASAPKPVAPPVAPEPRVPAKSEALASAPTVDPDAVAPPLPAAPIAPRIEERPAPRIEEPPALAIPPRAMAAPEPPVASAPVHGPAQMPPAVVERPIATIDPPAAPTPVAQQTVPQIEDRPLPPPSEWRDAQPLVPAPALTTTPLDLPIAPPAPSLGLPAPPSPPPAVAAVVPPAPLPSPLDWEVPAAPEQNVSSVGRASEGNTGAVTPAAPTPTAVSSPKAERPQARPGAGVPAAGQSQSRGSDRATAPQTGPVAQPLVGLGTAADFGSGGLSSQRTGERAALTSSSEGARGGAATATAPAFGREATGPAGVAAGEQSGTDARGVPAGAGAITAGAPSGTGETTGGGPSSGELRTDAGTGSGGQAIAQGGTAGAAQEAGAGGRGPGGVAITTPRNGYTLGPDEPPIVIVRGEVENAEITTIALTANSRRIDVPVRDRKFNYPLVVIDPTTKISAEVPLPAGRRSEAIVVHAAPNASTTGVILLDWGEVKPGGGIDMTAMWRARSDRLDGQQPMKLFVRNAPLPDDIPVSAFYLRNMQSGVYTFILGYRGLGGGTPFTPRFFLTSPGTPTARDLKPVKLAGTGKSATVRFLLPQAVLWEQDEWFTGRSEASDTITKFRDDGTTWIERKGEVR